MEEHLPSGGYENSKKKGEAEARVTDCSLKQLRAKTAESRRIKRIAAEKTVSA